MGVFRKQKNTAIVDDDDATTTFAERTRGNDIDNAFGQIPMGGSLSDGITGSGVQDIPDFIDIRLDETQEMGTDGYQFTVRVELMVENAGISVTPKLYDVTTYASPSLVTTSGGSASSSTTVVRQSLTFSHPSGTRFYRLKADKSASTYLAFMSATLERSVP